MNKIRKIFSLILFLFWNISYGNDASSIPNGYSDWFKNYDVKCYFFDLHVSNMTPEIHGSVSIYIEITDQNIDSLALELTNEAQIDSILIDTQRVNFAHSEEIIRIPLLNKISNGDLLVISVYYSLLDESDPDDRGITTSILPNGKSITWSLSEPFYSKNWFPCKQILADKADSAYLYFTTADSLKVGSNGILRQITPFGNNQVRYEWVTHYPTAFYLFSFTVADFIDYSFKACVNGNDSVPVQNYIYNDSSSLLTNKDDIDMTANLITVFSDKFGNYPFINEKYGHCLAPIGGGMEHQTMTTLGDFNFELVAHELAHQWFGNYVTCSDWQHIWLNEGFASYAEFIAIEALKTAEEKTGWLIDAYSLCISETDGSIFIPEEDSLNDQRIFNYRLSYRKGAYMIHMIRHELNDDQLFFEVLKTFQQQYANKTATAENFRQVLETLSHRSFETFFDQWYYGEGYPILSIRWKYNDDSLTINIDQQVSTPGKTQFFDISIDFRIFYLGGDTLLKIHQDSPSTKFVVPFKKRVYLVSPDPDNWLLKEIRSVERILEDDSVRFCAFPNPANDYVYIENFDIGLPFTTRIYNTNGVLLYERESTETFLHIPLSSYLKGFYQIVVSREKHKEIFRLVKL